MKRRPSLRAALLASAAIVPTLAALAFAQEPITEQPPPPPPAASADTSGVVVLDEITVAASKTGEPVATTLASVSQVSEQELEILQPMNASDIFFGVPGVTGQSDARRTQTSVNIRGLQDFGRVAVIVDGARNNFQRSDHGTQSVFWVEPEMLKEATIVRGPVANIYGSGAIGGVVVLETKAADDFLLPEERTAAALTGRYETNGDGFMTSATAAARISDAFGVIGNVVYRTADDFEDGDSDTVDGTGFDVIAGMAKATIRPADAHEIELGWIGNHDEWVEEAGAARDTELDQNTFTAEYDYSDPDNNWLDLHIGAYLNDTDQRQVQLEDEEQYDEETGEIVVVPAGAERGFALQTVGFDVWNTSRFDGYGLSHEVTYGGDWFRDEVETDDPIGGGEVYTPSGERQAYGAFLQDRVGYSDWLEIVGGVRFDGYSLDGTVDGEDVSSDGRRLSPRITIGVSPFERSALAGLQLYGTYAEGYRSPSVTETLISGLHPSGVTFPFLPNPDLEPETAKTTEFGVNYVRDGLFLPGDGLRVKAAIFNNDVDDYIELVTLTPAILGGDPECSFVPTPGRIPICVRYENVAEARIRGFEFESFYDAGRFFGGFNVTVLDGENLVTDEPLATVPPAEVTARLGFRFLREKAVVGGEVRHVFEDDDVDEPFVDNYTLVNLFAAYAPNDNFRFDLRLNNLFDETYANYLNVVGGEAVFEQGFNAKIGATIRFGAV
jgi:hemoglobin/transferrin/lactoferrin receptor protein